MSASSKAVDIAGAGIPPVLANVLAGYLTSLCADTVVEDTTGAGVTVDGCLLKDGFLHTTGTASVAAAGATQGTATALTTGANIITSATASTECGVKLPEAVAGRVVYVHNTTGIACKLWPASDDAINGADQINHAATLAAGKARISFAVNSALWVSGLLDVGVTDVNISIPQGNLAFSTVAPTVA